ncbi:MAG TPA: N-acetyltransferase [Planctomycetaceae bacterium]|nr:N-acetyltransferase [Blastopirellula sp.]HAY82696.1 N-acetyltransferase [Planctomycetaceae bacterium]
MIVKPVETKREQKQFLKLPWDLYQGDPIWIPPLRQSQRELVGYQHHPFYNENEVQTFLALEGDRAIGRIAAIWNKGHNQRYGEERGFFGFFECTENQEAANGLFDAAREWCAERNLHLLRGPTNPSLNYECGLLVDGFEEPPFFMMTYNKPYYHQLIENYGFYKAQDMYAFSGHVSQLESLDSKLDFIFNEAINRFNLKMRTLDRKNFLRDVELFLDIYNRSLVGTWGFVPMTDAEASHMAKGLKRLIVPQLTTILEVEGKPVGAAFSLLDYNARIKQIDGKLFPFGFIRLLWNRRQIKRLRLISSNVVPEWQKWGLGLVAMGDLLPRALEWGMEEGEFSWVLESNHLSYKTLKRGGAKITKTYRIYDYGDTPPAEQ